MEQAEHLVLLERLEQVVLLEHQGPAVQAELLEHQGPAVQAELLEQLELQGQAVLLAQLELLVRQAQAVHPVYPGQQVLQVYPLLEYKVMMVLIVVDGPILVHPPLLLVV